MKKIAEKVALVALTCITFIFTLITILYATNVIPSRDIAENSVAVVVLSVLAAIFIGLAIYLIYVNFSEKLNVKRILLYHDAESSTRANSKVIDNIVNGCAKQVSKVKVRRVKLHYDEKIGLSATVYVALTAEDVTEAIPQLRSLLVTSFHNTLGLKFNAINFEIDKLTKKFVPEVKPVEESAATEGETASVEATPIVDEKTAKETVSAETTAEAETIEYEDAMA